MATIKGFVARDKDGQLCIFYGEEDEKTRKKIIKFLEEQNYFDGKANEFKEPYKKECDWLKSLRPQSTWKPSDEQIGSLKLFIEHSPDYVYSEALQSLYNDLKKLREK